jgi:Domain of unknown function (DUF4136)
MKKVFLIGLLGAMVALFSACNAYTHINSTTDSKANFLKYKTFAWLADKADSANSPYNNEIIRNNIRNYFSKEMSDRGYVVHTEMPDLLLELTIKNEPHTVRQVYRGHYNYSRYYFRSIYYSPFERQYYYTYYHQYYYASPYPQVVTDTHINNSVTLNIIDAKERQLLWSGSVEADIYDPSVIQKDIHPAIIKLMKLFPVTPIKPNAAIALR